MAASATHNDDGATTGTLNMRKAIVTIAAGDAYNEVWRSKALPSWERFAKRHGYDIVAFHRLLDDSPSARERSPSWQKLLVLDHPQVRVFDRVLWLDADIIINDVAAPCPIEETPPERVGIVMDQAVSASPAMASTLKKVNGSFSGTAADLARWVYENNGLQAPAEFLLNGGVVVLSPVHDELLQHIYRTYRQGPLTSYEQTALSYELLTRNLHHLLDPRFNLLWLERQALMAPFAYWTTASKVICMAFALEDCFFLHFARRVEDMAQFDPSIRVSDGGQISIPLELAYRVSREWQTLAQNLANPR